MSNALSIGGDARSATATKPPSGSAAAAHESAKHIVQSLKVNVVIAIIKAVAAVFTGSAAMLAEALHSAADCGNQILLLIGVRRAARPPDATHPLGYGRAVYFWSFLVALMLFAGGGVFSVYEGVHKILHPEPMERLWLGLSILAASFVLEGGATISNIRELNRRRGATPFFRYLRDSKDSSLIVVFAENSAAVVGLSLAFGAMLIADRTGDNRLDGLGTVLVGLVLVVVATFLAREVTSLLTGESADPQIEAAARELAKSHAGVNRVLHVLTVQQGPGEVVVAIKLAFHSTLGIDEVCRSINDYEARLRAACPDVRWCFVEPDTPRTAEPSA